MRACVDTARARCAARSSLRSQAIRARRARSTRPARATPPRASGASRARPQAHAHRCDSARAQAHGHGRAPHELFLRRPPDCRPCRRRSRFRTKAVTGRPEGASDTPRAAFDCVRQVVLEEPEPVPDLVGEARPPVPNLVGLPEDRDLLAELALDARFLLRRGDGIERCEQRGHAHMREEVRAPRRLGRVRG